MVMVLLMVLPLPLLLLLLDLLLQDYLQYSKKMKRMKLKVRKAVVASTRPLNAETLGRLIRSKIRRPRPQSADTLIRKPKALSADRPKPHSKRTADEYDRNRQHKLPI